MLNKLKMLFGNLLPKFKMFIKGPKGSGKSTFALKLCEDLAMNGKVLYVAIEEEFNKGRISKRIKWAGVANPNIDFLEINSFDTSEGNMPLDRLLKYINTGKYDFVIIDSINVLEDFGVIKQKELMNLIREFDEISWVLIAQMDKTQRKHRGLAAWEFLVDTVVKLENLSAQTEKHRDGPNNRTVPVIDGINWKYRNIRNIHLYN